MQNETEKGSKKVGIVASQIIKTKSITYILQVGPYVNPKID